MQVLAGAGVVVPPQLLKRSKFFPVARPDVVSGLRILFGLKPSIRSYQYQTNEPIEPP